MYILVFCFPTFPVETKKKEEEKKIKKQQESSLSIGFFFPLFISPLLVYVDIFGWLVLAFKSTLSLPKIKVTKNEQV